MVSISLTNRIGFIILGLTNNFAYVVMLAAAFDLLKESTGKQNSQTVATDNDSNNSTTKYCNPHSTSTVLLADTIPSLLIKLSYPFLFMNLATSHKVIATATLSAISFSIISHARTELLIFSGVICASLSCGLGESTYLSNTPVYGNSALSGWSTGTGAAGLLGAFAYAILRILLPIKLIMIIMLVIPVAMLLAHFFVIKPYEDEDSTTTSDLSESTLEGSQHGEIGPIQAESNRTPRDYGGVEGDRSLSNTETGRPDLTLGQKVAYLPNLAKYFIPLLLVYFAEYFINQGLFELIYYPEIKPLDHATQYSWFQVSYQLGVMVSRSSLDVFKIKRLWAMALLQVLNAFIFLAHASRLIHIPNFYTVIFMIVYEGLLGGFTYTNTYYRLKNELPPGKREFGIGAVTVADTMGIVAAGALALPVHDALCKLYGDDTH